MAMKCPVCQSESSEGRKYCAECGAELPQPEQTPDEQPIVAVSTDPKAEAKRRKWLIPILATAIVAILIGAALGVYFSPDYSWDASIRDHDGDGYSDTEDVFPYDSTEWIDTDEDGYGDNCDCFPEDGDEWADSDADGIGDNSDDLPTEPTQWEDTDGDGYGDNSSGADPDAFPDDPSEWNDTDDDDVGDNSDEFPDDPDEWKDTDGDGYGDNSDAFPEDGLKNTPVVSFGCDEMLVGFIFECTYTDMPIAWDEITFSLTDHISTVAWKTANSTALSDHPFVTHNLGIRNIAGMSVTLTVTDVIGNGVLEEGDVFIITAEGGFEAGVDFQLEVIYEPTGGSMDTQFFTMVLPATPTSSLTKSAVSSGVKLTFAPISVDTQWDDITILLSDGTNTVQWSPATANLSSGVASKQLFEVKVLGSLNVYCNVTDLAGNGYVNQGDYIVLTTGGGETFSTATTYICTIMHDPTSNEVCYASFVG